MNERTQCEAIRKHLKSGRSLTALEALQKFGSMRLGARIWDLKKQGVPIVKRMVDVGHGKEAKRIARYYQISA